MRRLFIIFMFLSDLLSAQGNRADLFGFNTNTLFIFMDIYDTNSLNLVKQISPKVLRFPGGYGNFYHVNGSGYGFNYNEAFQNNNGNLPKRLKGINRIIGQKNHKNNYLDDFIYLAKKLNSKVIIDANILTANFDETFEIITRLQENGLDIRGVEIGSELYNASFQKSIDAVRYVKLAKLFSNKLFSSFPNIDIAVVVAPLNRNYNRHKEWNQLLANEDFYDAIIIHTYAKVIKGLDVEGQMIKEVPENLNNKLTFEIYRERALKFLYKSYEDEIIKYSLMFNNKPIWVTEWNIQMSKTTGNTMFQSLFVSTYVLELLANKKLNHVELAIYHNLAGRDISGSIFRETNIGMETHSTFYSFKIISKIFKQEIKSVTRRKINEHCYEYLCVFADLSEEYIWINWSDQVVDINLREEVSCSKLYFFGDQLFSKNSIDDELRYIKEKNSLGSSISLNPYSVTMIENIIK